MYRNDLIKAKKAAKDLTIEQICIGANLSPTTVDKILSGKKNIEYRSLVRVAEFLDISLSDLFSEKQIEQVI